MHDYFHMEPSLFEKWIDMLIDEGYDWKQIGISNEYCNTISVPKYGVEIVDWQNCLFKIRNDKKYTVFLLRYQ
jgi:hypothetical protein